MACVTLKRPLEWTDPSMSPESGSSSPTHMIISNSPPHHGLRSPKRICLQSIATNNNNGLSQSSSPSFYCNQYSTFLQKNNQQPTFATNNNTNCFKQISSSEIADQIREEMIRLRLIRRISNSKNIVATKYLNQQAKGGEDSGDKSKCGLLDNNNNCNNQNSSATSASSSSSSSNSSSSSSSKSSESSSTSSHHPFNLYNISGGNLRNLSSENSSKKSPVINNNNNNGASLKLSNCGVAGGGAWGSNNNSNNDKPLFTFNQVVMIVERLLRDKEESIRREFEEVLTNRLAEQYDQFVKFSYDQIQRRFDSQNLPSYLS